MGRPRNMETATPQTIDDLCFFPFTMGSLSVCGLLVQIHAQKMNPTMNPPQHVLLPFLRQHRRPLPPQAAPALWGAELHGRGQARTRCAKHLPTRKPRPDQPIFGRHVAFVSRPRGGFSPTSDRSGPAARSGPRREFENARRLVQVIEVHGGWICATASFRRQN